MSCSQLLVVGAVYACQKSAESVRIVQGTLKDFRRKQAKVQLSWRVG